MKDKAADGDRERARALVPDRGGEFRAGSLGEPGPVERWGPRVPPAVLLALAVAAIFAVEALVMVGLDSEGRSPGFAALLDGLLVSVLTVPALYLLLVRPLVSHLRDLERTRAQLETSREAYRSLIESTEDSIYLVDAGCRYLFVNRFHAARLGLPEGRYLGRHYGDFHAPEKTAEFERIVAEVVRSGSPARYEHWSRRDGRWFLRTFAPVRDGGGGTSAVTVVSKDITELKELSTTDELTGLQNRRGFSAIAAHRLRVAGRAGEGLTLLYADLDNLKAINDAAGHPAGDRAIRDAASVLAGSCRDADVVARVGGDEFAVLLPGPAAQAAHGVVARIREGLRRHNAAAGGGMRLSLSIGVAECVPGERCSIDELVRRADRAMYEDKERAHQGVPAAGAPGRGG